MKTEPTKAMPLGASVHGKYCEYIIDAYLSQDGFGILYEAKAMVTPQKGGKPVESRFVIREFFMHRCSSRGEDGCEVYTPEDVAPTVQNFKEYFAMSSHNCAEISKGCANIINVIEVVEEHNTYYYIVEYLEGETFEDYVNRKGPLSIYETRELLSPIFKAVRHMHRAHTIHTDIYPRHVRFVMQGTKMIPVLYSLYASRCFDDSGSSIWPSAILVCRQGYAPPEQYKGVDHFIPETDIYALASMMVFALSGKHLPDSRIVTEKDIRNTLPATLPETMVETLLHGLEHDFVSRPSSVSAFADELVGFYDENAKYRTPPRRERPGVIPTDDSETVAEPLSLIERFKDWLAHRFSNFSD